MNKYYILSDTIKVFTMNIDGNPVKVIYIKTDRKTKEEFDKQLEQVWWHNEADEKTND
jgi:hypothetical protein